MEVLEVGDGARLGDELLVEDATKGDHGEAGVLDLLELQVGEGLRLLAEAERVEAEVAGDRALIDRVAVELEADDAAGGLGVEEDVDVAEEEEDLEPAGGGDLSLRRAL